MLLDRFSKCGVLVFRMKRTVSDSVSETSVFEESDVQLFDLVSHPEYLQQMIHAAVAATGFFFQETAPFLAEAVSACLRTRFNVCQETLLCLGKSKVVVVVDVETKRVGEEKGYRILRQHRRVYKELCYEDDDGDSEEDGEEEERGLMISVNEVESDEAMMETDSDEKTFEVDVFGDYYDDDCAEIIYSMMNSLSKTPDFLRQGCVISDEFQEFKEVKGGLKMKWRAG